MNIYLFLLIASVIRLGLALLFPLTADEAYYWLWSKHLALSYVDHPPLVALVNYLTTFGTANLLTLRLGVVLITLLVSLGLYRIARELFDERVAFWSVVLFQILPHFVVVWLTQFIELPLALCWVAALWLLVKIVKTRQPFWWYWLAVAVGLGTLCKYTMFLFWPSLLIFFWLSPENRFWLKRREPYLCLLLTALCFSPVLIWNAQHSWISFTFHGSKLSGEIWGRNLLPFLADQLVHFTPFLLFSLYNVFQFARKRSTETKLLYSFSAPLLLLFLLLPLKIKVWAHWPSIGYLAALPLTVNYLLETDKSLKKFLTWIGLFTGLVLVVLFFVSPGVLLHQGDYARNRQLARIVPAEYKLFAKTNVAAALLEFYTGRQTYLATGAMKVGQPWGEKQYELWGIPEVKKGENVLYYGDDNPFFEEKAAANFAMIRELPSVRLYLVEDYITNNFKMFLLEGYKGLAPHP
ncbi:MAG: glycosyltransferase family 39 protein [Candidatus Margulisbacteria bacterium]|jgi:4-amino-4-deoxy-L-arabinose transferase-like glycosyltransferase|nr:glycosyltransferase family 39 protein [Candidatus Margulisiibacteriota bacterium]